jgi:UDP-N-acetylglucosamine transferase subunit ALG13
MIFVTIGTTKPFDRLLRAVETLEIPSGEELIVQCGDSTVRPSAALCLGFLPFDELAAHVRRARIVIAHAGAGTAIAALSLGARPIIVPRLARFDEAADDHQVDFARRLAEAGLVTLVEDLGGLSEAVATLPTGPQRPGPDVSGSLALEVRDYLRLAVNGRVAP